MDHHSFQQARTDWFRCVRTEATFWMRLVLIHGKSVKTLANLGYTRSSFKVRKGFLTTPHTSNLESIPLLSNHRHSLKYCRNGLQVLRSKFSCFLSNKQWQETARTVSIQINRCIWITGIRVMIIKIIWLVSLKSAAVRTELQWNSQICKWFYLCF